MEWHCHDVKLPSRLVKVLGRDKPDKGSMRYGNGTTSSSIELTSKIDSWCWIAQICLCH
ncbi:hypothetical protein Csa_009340 [Cucumis sativus]|uniref:Uncharacterized protein n=1 Tax=Cucumis sativus TaxID=3659 RepID=A0A0A0KRT3_CUCSA|nr:hypothetical protein Csa_009340 [Cucumis sativus]